jgi:acetylglutamate kinase
LALLLGARELIFCTPFPGVRGRAGTVVRDLDVSAAKALIADGTARSGMALKLRVACKVARAGCAVRILGGDVRSAGTALHAEVVPADGWRVTP